MNVADEEAVIRADRGLRGEFGPITGVVNSAGIGRDVPALDTSADLFRKMLEVNLIGSFVVSREAAKHMQARGGGSIVNIASVSGIKGNKGRVAYGASKGGVLTMTKVMAVELAPLGHPGERDRARPDRDAHGAGDAYARGARRLDGDRTAAALRLSGRDRRGRHLPPRRSQVELRHGTDDLRRWRLHARRHHGRAVAAPDLAARVQKGSRHDLSCSPLLRRLPTFRRKAITGSRRAPS